MLLFELIELFLLIVAQERADLFVGPIERGSRTISAVVGRHGFVLHRLLRGVMHFLEDGFNSGLLIAGEIQFLGQHFQVGLDFGRFGVRRGRLRGRGQGDEQRPDCQ